MYHGGVKMLRISQISLIENAKIHNVEIGNRKKCLQNVL